MPAYAYIVIMAGWLAWTVPFVLFRRKRPKASQVDRRARWGILLVGLGFAVEWQGRFWEMSLAPWQLALGIVFFILASVLSWTAVRALGSQWRIEAGLNPQHELVTSGPYRFIRHPIYTSLLCVIWAMGVMVAPPLLFVLSTVLAVVGTEIRVRVEDGLLALRFGKQFEDYRRSVAAYIPFIR
jgi:protein-S-isoprenylcysteine O-methyltransferase Ste14